MKGKHRLYMYVCAVFVQKNNIDDQSEGDTYDKSYMSGCMEMEVLCFIHVTILSPPPSPGLLIFCVSLPGQVNQSQLSSVVAVLQVTV